ncbi:hypothetical protein BH10PSE2_BH10PSE2_03260 [soil metagenome]
MTALTPASTYTPRRTLLLAAIALGAVALGGWLGFRYGHAPNWTLLMAQAPVLHLHIAAALTALLLGTVQLVGVKGTGAHRVIGWSWVVAMVTVAISSFFIRMLHPGAFSWIHLISGWTLIAVPMAIVAVRRGRIRNHARGMTLTFIGGLIIAGALTFLPGRLMWKIFFG